MDARTKRFLIIGTVLAALPLRSQSDPSDVLAASFTSAEVGWAITRSAVRRTVDGGQAWQDVTPPEVRAAQAGALKGSVSLADARTPHALVTWGSSMAWIAVPKPGEIEVVRTADAGQTWKRSAMHPESDIHIGTGDTPLVDAMAFVNDRTGWVMVSAIGGGAGSQDVELYGTVDGGSTWRLLSYTDSYFESSGVSVPSSESVSRIGDKTGISFATPERGWITGYSNTAEHNEIWLYATIDGGATWHSVGETLRIPARYAGLAGSPITLPPTFSNGTRGVLPVTDLGRTANVVFYVTDDAGISWAPTTPAAGTPGPRTYSWPDAQHGFFADTSGTTSWLLATEDGG